MSNRCRAAILIGILTFYILLSALESVEYKNAANNQSKGAGANNSRNSVDETVTVGDQVINLTQYLNDPMVKGFKEIHQMDFTGDYEITQAEDSYIFSEFENPSGRITAKFSNDFMSMGDWQTYGRSRNSTFKMMLLDGEYFDNKMYMIEFTEPLYRSFNISTLEYAVNDRVVKVFEAEKLELKNFVECKINLSMSLGDVINHDKGRGYKLNEDAPIAFMIESNNEECNFQIKSTLTKDETDMEKKTINYSVLLTFMAIINLYSIAKMIKQSIDSPTQASQLSLLTLGFILIWDTYICLGHLYLALSIETLFHFFIMPTFWYFILFSIFEMKLLVIAWKTRYWNQFQNQEQARKGLASFYLKLYIGMIVILFLLYKFILYNWFILLMSLYLVPQIIHNAMRGGRIEFDTNYMFLVIGLRALLPLYFRGCPYNMMKLKPDYPFCVALLLVIGVQILVIYYQSIRGSKFFIPARFLPKQYDYLYDLPEDLESGIEFDDCAVCMNPLHQQPDVSTSVNPHARMVMNRLKPEKGQVMKTPCNHKFHVTCLVEWMSIKMECPTCRAALPVLE